MLASILQVPALVSPPVSTRQLAAELSQFGLTVLKEPQLEQAQLEQVRLALARSRRAQSPRAGAAARGARRGRRRRGSTLLLALLCRGRRLVPLHRQPRHRAASAPCGRCPTPHPHPNPHQVQVRQRCSARLSALLDELHVQGGDPIEQHYTFAEIAHRQRLRWDLRLPEVRVRVRVRALQP